MSVDKTPEQQSIEAMANSAKQSTTPGDAIKARLNAAQEVAEESLEVIAVTRLHSGREHYLSEANAEVYDALMGDKPLEVDGRLFSTHAMSKGFAFLKSNNLDYSSENFKVYERIRDKEQDLIDEQIESLKLLKTPESLEDLEKTLQYISHKTGVTVSGIKKLSAAIKHHNVLTAFEKVGLTPPATYDTASEREIKERKIAALSKQSGASKIEAALLKGNI
ncbi:hypothetical protein RII69_003974 [Vibrio parahaemolyticus]|nr:hypothetical protein [Vibrio parahaemolyticus]ELC0687692.1 hypothetical protein [Vibrio parahaemolyticus]